MHTRPVRWMIAGVAIAVGVAAHAEPARDRASAVAQAPATPPAPRVTAPRVTAPAPATTAPNPRRTPTARPAPRPSRAETAAVAARRSRQNAELLRRMAHWRVIDVEAGDAHWYGPGFHGRRTASGERFDRSALTAAHRDVPLGTYARVTSMRTGRAVIVRINDRHGGPEDAVIDLSQGAASEIGVQGRGASPVRVEILQPP
ncbi:MAG: septal ring lytic transglycosylase RlpA family protein [Alphaproteobacteria bacterium]|nr:septal ring lytic transglycosylase RlpA family protein [Alphaproteobacteria bacterium]